MNDGRPRDWQGRFAPDGGDPDLCRDCGKPRDRSKRNAKAGRCAPCWRRWSDNGFPSGGAPAPRRRGESVSSWQLAEFARRDRPGERGASAELAREYGVTRRTLTRWRRKLETTGPSGVRQ